MQTSTATEAAGNRQPRAANSLSIAGNVRGVMTPGSHTGSCIIDGSSHRGPHWALRQQSLGIGASAPGVCATPKDTRS